MLVDGKESTANDDPKRTEAIKIRLKGTQAENYDIYYRVYTSNYGWLGWAKNDEESGTKGYDCQAEAIQIVAGKKEWMLPEVRKTHLWRRIRSFLMLRMSMVKDG